MTEKPRDPALNPHRKLPADPEAPDTPEPARAGELEATVTVSYEPATSSPAVDGGAASE